MKTVYFAGTFYFDILLSIPVVFKLDAVRFGNYNVVIPASNYKLKSLTRLEVCHTFS